MSTTTVLEGEKVVMRCKTCGRTVQGVISADQLICNPHQSSCEDDCPCDGSSRPGDPIK